VAGMQGVAEQVDLSHGHQTRTCRSVASGMVENPCGGKA